jgi:hypothetical protein
MLSFEGFTLHSNNGFDLEYTANERVKLFYERFKSVGNTTYEIPTLGKFLEFNYEGDNLFAYTYFRNQNSAKKTEKEGLLLYKLDPVNDAETEPFHTCVFSNDGDDSRVHAVHIGLGDEFVIISRQNKKNTILKTSSGDSKNYTEKISIAQAFAAYINKNGTADESAGIDCVSPVGNGYVGMDFEGMSNSYGNTKRVVIYDYRK